MVVAPVLEIVVVAVPAAVPPMVRTEFMLAKVVEALVATNDAIVPKLVKEELTIDAPSVVESKTLTLLIK